MKKWISLLLCLLLVLGMGAAAMAEETADPLGDIEGNTYSNELFGFKAALPDNWRFLSYTDMASYMGYDQEFASREGLAALLERDSNVCAMYAAATDDLSANINFMVQDMGVYAYLDEQTYYSIVEGSLPEVLQPQGYTDIQMTQKTFRIAGAEHAGGEMTGKLGTFQMFMDIVVFKADKYIGSLTIASFSQEKNEEALGFFEPLEGAGRVLSTSKGQRYENKALGISVDFDEGWYLMNEEERAQQMGLLDSAIQDEDLIEVMSDALESGKSVCDMNARKMDGNGDNVNLILTNMGVLGIFAEEEQYFKLAEQGLYNTYKSMGCQEITITCGETILCGKSHYGAEIEASLNGIRYYQRQVYIKSGTYIGALTIFSRDRSQLDVIAGMFKPCA